MAAAVTTFHAYSVAFNPVRAKINREECSHMKLLGVAELADGSLNFQFGVAPEGSTSSGNIPDTTMAAQPQVAVNQLPVRLPSAFVKRSPISFPIRRRELPTRTKEAPSMEAEFRKPAPVAEEIPSTDFKKSEAHVLDRVEETTSHSSHEAVSRHDQPNRTVKGQTVPLRMKSKFVKQSPVPARTGATHTTLDILSETTVTGDGAKKASSNITLEISTFETSESAKGDRAVRSGVEAPVDVSTQPVDVTAETSREHVAGEFETSAKSTPDAVLEGNETNSATVAGDSQEVPALNIQGLSIPMGSENSAEEHGEINLGSKAERIETLNACKLPDLKSMAKSRGLKGYSKLKKGDLIELLSQLD